MTGAGWRVDELSAGVMDELSARARKHSGRCLGSADRPRHCRDAVTSGHLQTTVAAEERAFVSGGDRLIQRRPEGGAQAGALLSQRGRTEDKTMLESPRHPNFSFFLSITCI